jgi:hypothetical protein
MHDVMHEKRSQTYGFGWQSLLSCIADLGQGDLLTICDAAQAAMLNPQVRAQHVSTLLSLCFRSADAAPFDPMRLSIIDRAAALFAVSFSMGRWPARFVTACCSCNEAQTLRVNPDEFTYRAGTLAQDGREGRGYICNLTGLSLMQPNGHHEAKLAMGGQLSLADLILSETALPKESESGAGEAACLQALLARGAQMQTALPWSCGACGADNQFWFDPLRWIVQHTQPILHEVHQIARAYGWSEEAILNLSAQRRQAYVALIEAGRDG